MSEYVYQSILAPYIEGLLKEKRANGYDYRKEERVLRRFDIYCKDNNLNTLNVTRDFLAGWMIRAEDEGPLNQNSRICTVRQLLLFMASMGITVYIPNRYCSSYKAMPHIFTPEEIRNFFYVLDTFETDGIPMHKRLHQEYRLLFRIYCSCGLRNNEACGILTENVNINDGVLTILNAKGHKDRLVYMAEDLTDSCRRYFDWLCKAIGFSPLYFFPGMNLQKSISNTTMCRVFTKFWQKTDYADCSNKPTIHDFRFTFVVNRMNTWAEEGKDLRVMAPYLSRYLGHKTTKETFYYYYLVADAYKTVRKKDTMAGEVIPEVEE